jgi:ABC-type multidrug transport system permease subunit
MMARADVGIPDVYPGDGSSGAVKFLRDSWSVLEMKSLFLLRDWYWYIIRPMIFPIGVLFWLRIIVPDDLETNRRILAGALVFGVSLSNANLLAQQILQDRFLGRLKILVTMPMSKCAYATGVMAFAAMQSTPIVVVLTILAPIVGVDMSLNWAFFPMIFATLLGVAGIALMISSYAPSMEVGGIMSNLFGVVLVMVSPVFFTMEQAPLALKLVGWISPMRYASDGITKSIGGQTDVWLEFVVIAVFAITTIALGLWKLRWREE